jgi:LPXTG-motif cell wall-anchored protein
VPDADRPEPAPEPAAEPAASGAADLKPLDVDGVGAVLYGTIAWTVALVACLLLRDRLAADGHGWFVWASLAGALLGLAGLGFVRRRAAIYRAAGH